MKLQWVLTKNSLRYAWKSSFPGYPVSSRTIHWITRKYSSRRPFRVKKQLRNLERGREISILQIFLKLQWVLTKTSLRYAWMSCFPGYPVSSRTIHWITRKYSSRRTYRVKNNFFIYSFGHIQFQVMDLQRQYLSMV